MTPFCSGSGCLVQRASTRPAARLPAERWSASARAATVRAPAGRGRAGAGVCCSVVRAASLIGSIVTGRVKPAAEIPAAVLRHDERGHDFFPPVSAERIGSLGMPVVVDVPLNTAIADLDEALRKLPRRELERPGFGAGRARVPA